MFCKMSTTASPYALNGSPKMEPYVACTVRASCSSSKLSMLSPLALLLLAILRICGSLTMQANAMMPNPSPCRPHVMKQSHADAWKLEVL